MKKDWWLRFKRAFKKNFIDFLMIFAAEDDFIHKHKQKSSMIAEQDRYGTKKDTPEHK
ncbi:hypothetical protein [Limosilactobacillus sp.]|uniref:hypothetical protein n=1 Tax=Limosilactobacillus sp. TaxID=2773925 RepID=UPI003F0636AD